MEDDDRIRLLVERCYRFIMIRPRSAREIQQYLVKKNTSEDLTNKVIAILIDKELIDDEVFCRWWIESRATFKQKGAYALRQELIQKGVSKDTIESVMGQEKGDEVTLAVKALTSKTRTFDIPDREKRFQKAISFLQRRGFTFTTAKKAFEEWNKI